MKKIPKQYSGVLIGAIVSTLLSALVSLYITWVNLGWSGKFFLQWLTAWSGAWPMAFILAIILTPLAKHWVEKITE